MSKKDRYIYPAIFDYAADGILVEIPDSTRLFNKWGNR
jgi:hypothetical protein